MLLYVALYAYYVCLLISLSLINSKDFRLPHVTFNWYTLDKLESVVLDRRIVLSKRTRIHLLVYYSIF